MIIAKLLLVALLQVPAGHHFGWQHNPHNPHHRPVPTCQWVVGNAIGDVPHCIPTA